RRAQRARPAAALHGRVVERLARGRLGECGGGSPRPLLVRSADLLVQVVTARFSKAGAIRAHSSITSASHAFGNRRWSSRLRSSITPRSFPPPETIGAARTWLVRKPV